MTFFKTFSKKPLSIYLTTIIVGTLLSIYAVKATDVINNDGILYIYTANAFLEGGFSKAMTVFSWPLFSMMIAWFHTLTGADMETSAYAVNALFLIIASITFLCIYEEISSANLPLWIPALIILALPILNDYRAYIIRGHGAWAFTLLALLYFIHYAKQPTIRSALLWQAFAIAGMLFRIEGLVFLVFAPFFFLISKEHRKTFFRHFIRLNSILIPFTISAITYLFNYILKMDGLSDDLQLRLSYMLPSSMLIRIKEAASGVEALMPDVSSGEAVLITASGLAILVFFKLIKNINLFYLAIWVYGYRKQWVNLSKESNIVLFFALISLLPLIAIAGNQLFMSSRYTVLPIILLSLIFCQYFEYLFYKLMDSRRFRAVTGMFFLVILFFLDAIIHTGAIKGNLVTASTWVSRHIESDTKMACSDTRFSFYTKGKCTYEEGLESDNIKDMTWLIKEGKYNYLLLWVDHNDKQIRNYLGASKSLVLLKSFGNKKGDEARFYMISVPGNHNLPITDQN